MRFSLPILAISGLTAISRREQIEAVVVGAGVVGLATAGLPFRLGLIVSAAAAIGAGMLVERPKSQGRA